MQTKANTVKVIDVSNWQNVVSWQQVKDSGVQAVYLKATEGTSFKDRTFLNNLRGAQSVGLLVGAYHFTDFKDPVAEAANFLSMINGHHLDLIPVLDMEADPVTSDPTIWARSFISAVGHPFMFYSYTDWIATHNPDLGDLPLWIADYRNIDSPPNVGAWTEFAMWQYSQSGTIAGIVGNGVDLSAAVSLEALKGEQDVNMKRTTTSALHLRVAPGTDFAIRNTFPKGKEITIDKLYGDWAHTPDGHRWGGWVSRKYLMKTESEK